MDVPPIQTSLISFSVAAICFFLIWRAKRTGDMSEDFGVLRKNDNPFLFHANLFVFRLMSVFLFFVGVFYMLKHFGLSDEFLSTLPIEFSDEGSSS